jgi:hypothetical protein
LPTCVLFQRVGNSIHDAIRRCLAHRSEAYSPECGEVEFSEVRGSKRPIICGGKYSTTAWRRRFGVETRRLRTFRCAFVYQGVATRNDATTREILAHRTGTQLNFAFTEF